MRIFNMTLMFKNKLILFFAFLALAVLAQIISSAIINLFSPQTFDHIQHIPSTKLFGRLMNMILIAPLIETLVFQFLAIEIMMRLQKSIIFAVILSSVVFSICHTYSFHYMIYVLPVGLTLGSYYALLRKKNTFLAYLAVCGVHSLVNLLAFIVNYS